VTRPPALLSVCAAVAAATAFVVLVACRDEPSATTGRGRGPGEAPRAVAVAGHVGSGACAECHRHEARLWADSHHAHAMRAVTPEVAADVEQVRDADVVTRLRGAAYEFGVWPLRQVLLPAEGGRLQAFDVAWDARATTPPGARWFRLRPEEGPIGPGDVLHWAEPHQTWNLMCADCHSTALRKGYRAADDSYATTWAEVSVGCEACHGAGERHVAWARGARDAATASKGLAVVLRDSRPVSWVLDPASGIRKRVPPERPPAQVETCAPCHSRRERLADGGPGTPFLDAYLPALLDDGLYHADGQVLEEDYEWASFLESRMHARGVACSDCHGPHGSGAKDGKAAAACANCHLSERFAVPSHTHHAAGSPGSSCVACHMPERTYMVVHERRDHSIRVPRPDLTVSIGVPNACGDCHAEKGAAWAADEAARLWGGKRRETPHWGTAIEAGRQGAPGAEGALAAVVRDPEAPAIARATCASLLGGARDAAGRIALRLAAGDPDALVRLGAARAGETVPFERRWNVLGDLLGDARRAVRVVAARALAPLAGEAPDATARERLDRALAEWRAARAGDADRAEAHASLGTLALDLGRAEEAERELSTAVRLDPGFGPARVNLADLHRARGRDGDGERVLREGLALTPSDAGMHFALGLLLVRTGRRAEALPHLVRAAESAPRVARFGYVLGVARESDGDVEGARRAFEAVLARHPFDAETRAALDRLPAR
jgi:Flp pilus assembly protein TadD